MTYQQVLQNIADGTAKLIEDLWSLVPVNLTEAEFRDMAAELVAIGRVRGVAAAEAAFRAYLETALGQVAVVALAPVVADRARMAVAVSTILADDDLDKLPRLVRLAHNEPVQAATDAFAAQLRENKQVIGWRRGLDADPCQLCRWWHRDGRVWRPDHPMPRHKGCTCHQIPVVDLDGNNTQTEQQAHDRRRERRHN